MALERLDASDVTLKLNGEVVDTYTQADDSTYDISAAAENQNTKTLKIRWDDFNSTETYENPGRGASFTVDESLDGYTGSISTSGSFTYNSSERDDINWSGTFSAGDTFSCYYDGVGDDDAVIDHLTVTVNIPVDPEASPNGSTKS